MCAFTYNYKPYAWGWDIKLSQQRLWFNLLNKRGPHVDSYFHFEFLVQIVFNGIYQVFNLASLPRPTKVSGTQSFFLTKRFWSCYLTTSEYWMAESLWIYVLIICWNISVHLFSFLAFHLCWRRLGKAIWQISRVRYGFVYYSNIT